MSARRIASALGGAAAYGVLALIRLAAWSLAPFRLGRLLRAVSVPRMQDHKLRTSLTVLGIAMGVAVLVSVEIVNNSVLRGVAATVDEIAGKTDLQISGGTSGFSEELLAKVRATPGVFRAASVMQQTVTMRDAHAQSERLLLLGVDMLEDQDEYFRGYGSNELGAIRSDPLAFLNSPHNILISRAVARRYGLRLHDKVSLTTGNGIQQFDIWGFLDDVGVGRAFGGSVAVMYYQAMQVAFDRGQNIDRIDVAVTPGLEIGAVEARLQRTLGGGFIVERPARKGTRMSKMLIGVRSGLTTASVLALLVGGFLIHNTMSISVVQRKREIGILRALGSKQGEIVALLTLEGCLLGFVGSLFGSVVGIGLSRVLLTATSRAVNQVYLQLATTDVRIDPLMLAASIAVGTLAATVASALPARRAAVSKPAETLRTASLMQTAPPSLRPGRSDLLALILIACAFPLLRLPPFWRLPLGAFAAGLSLLAAAALLLPRLVQLLEGGLRPISARWLRVEARLANQNLPRDLGRTAATASALMAGVALAVSFGVFTHSFSSTLEDWIDQTLPGDLFVTQAASMGGISMRNVPMADTLSSAFAAMPEIEAVRRVHVVEMPYQGLMLKAVATDVDVLVEHGKLVLLEGELAQVLPALKQGAIVVSENFARHFHVGRGDRVALSTYLGTRNFDVVGVMVDYSSDVGSLLIERAVYIEKFRDSRVGTYELHLQKSSDAERVRRRINGGIGKNHDLFVLTNSEFKAEVRQATDQVFSLVRALEMVALAVAVLGIINAQLANVLDRVREIGVLRALGMLRKQVARMVVIEAALVGCIGTVAGILVGLALGVVMLDHINLVQNGWYFPYRVSLAAILEVCLLTLPAAALAGLYPARKAASLVVTDALEYE